MLRRWEERFRLRRMMGTLVQALLLGTTGETISVVQPS